MLPPPEMKIQLQFLHHHLASKRRILSIQIRICLFTTPLSELHFMGTHTPANPAIALEKKSRFSSFFPRLHTVSRLLFFYFIWNIVIQFYSHSTTFKRYPVCVNVEGHFFFFAWRRQNTAKLLPVFGHSLWEAAFLIWFARIEHYRSGTKKPLTWSGPNAANPLV